MSGLTVLEEQVIPDFGTMMELRGVCKRFGATTALYSMDLTVASGSTTVLLGPSGCGKSTVLRLLVGLLRPDTGEILFRGQAVSTDHLSELRHRLGYVIQDGGLFPHLTARANVTLMARYLGWRARQISTRLDELVELTRFPVEGLDRYPVQLSGGQRQRVGLMRALMLDPDVLLLDEPLGALDPMVRSELQDDLKLIFDRLDKTVLMVTHDLSEANFFGDRLVLMRAGRIIQEGNLENLVNAPADPFVTRFISAQRPLESLRGARS